MFLLISVARIFSIATLWQTRFFSFSSCFSLYCLCRIQFIEWLLDSPFNITSAVIYCHLKFATKAPSFVDVLLSTNSFPISSINFASFLNSSSRKLKRSWSCTILEALANVTSSFLVHSLIHGFFGVICAFQRFIIEICQLNRITFFMYLSCNGISFPSQSNNSQPSSMGEASLTSAFFRSRTTLGGVISFKIFQCLWIIGFHQFVLIRSETRSSSLPLRAFVTHTALNLLA